MAEIASYEAAEIAAGRKLHPSKHNRVRAITFRTPATYDPAENDTIGSGQIIPKGSKLLPGPVVTNATNAASVVMSVGIRKLDAAKTAIDATAFCASLAGTTAAVATPLTGTKVRAADDYVTVEDSEPYLTLGGATPNDNVKIEVTVFYVAP